MFSKQIAFTLVELMITIVIIGILAAIAIPSYKQYILHSKMSEAYTLLDVTSKNELKYFAENDRFYNIGGNIAAMGDAPPIVIAQHARWDILGYPAPIGTNTYFDYYAYAGKTDDGGVEIAGSYGVAVTGMFKTITHDSSSCNNGMGPSTFGVALEPSYDWSVVGAVSDFDNDNTNGLCTLIYRMMYASPSTEGKPFQNAYVIVNYGN